MRRNQSSGNINCEKPWLVKSSGRLIGPFSSAEVEEKLQTREIVPLDELIAPQGRWRYVADEPTFADLARRMKNDEVEERTMTSTVDAGADDLTDTVDIAQVENFRKTLADGVVGGEQGGAPNFNEPSQVKSYGLKGDRNIENEAIQRSKWMWPAAVVAIVVVLGMTFFGGGSDSEKRNPSFLVRKGKLALEFGEKRDAIDFFVRALRADKSNSEAILALTPLVAQVDKDFVMARRLLGQLEHSESQTAEVFAIHGLIELLDQKIEEAEKWIDKSLALNSRYIPALVNKMAILMNKGNFNELAPFFDRIIKVERAGGAATMLIVQSYLAQYRQTGEAKFKTKAIEMIRVYLSENSDYKQEMLLALNYINFVLNKNGNKKALQALLNMDPYQTQHHLHDPLIYRTHMNWDSLLPWCKQIHESEPKSVRAEALYAVCMIKARQTVQAEEVLGRTLKKDPNDLLLSAIRGYLMIETQNEEKGLRLLKHISKRQPHNLALFLIGHQCDGVDPKCAMRAWDLIRKRDNRSLAALHGIAKNSLETDDTDRAREYLNLGTRISPNYYPLKKVSWQLEHGIDID